MDEILNATRYVNQLLKESKEYQRFIFARNQLRANTDLYQRLKEMKERYKDVQAYWEGNPYDEIYRICQENDELLHNSVVNEYLRAESALSHLIRMMVDTVVEGFHIDFE
ncbi:MAG: YlbF family regulator [Eubacterium sp.]|nr:YlbF family regulator [Eubacterium sp.]